MEQTSKDFKTSHKILIDQLADLNKKQWDILNGKSFDSNFYPNRHKCQKIRQVLNELLKMHTEKEYGQSYSYYAQSAI